MSEVDLFIETMQERANRAGAARPDGLVLTATPAPLVFAQDEFGGRPSLLQDRGNGDVWTPLPYGLDGESSPVENAQTFGDVLVGPYDVANSRFYRHSAQVTGFFYDVVARFRIGDAADLINIGLAARLRYDDIGYVCRYSREAGTDSVCICKLVEGEITTIDLADLDDQLPAGEHTIRFALRLDQQTIILDESLAAMVTTDTQLTQPDSVGIMAPGALADLGSPFDAETNPVVNWIINFRAESISQPVYL